MEIKVNPEEFKKLYAEMTLGKLAEHYDVKVNQVIKIAKLLGLNKHADDSNRLEIE